MQTINYPKINKDLLNFRNRNDNLKIIKRNVPNNSDIFFKMTFRTLSSVSGFISKTNSKKDINRLLENQISENLKHDPFYDFWLNDMGNMCNIFCKFLGTDKISFWLGTKRGCKRYHVDMVPFRLLVTYAGKGTELLPDHAANRKAFEASKSNEEIVLDSSSLEYINKWDIAIFRGGKTGILHRTPESVINGESSILMRIDTPSFLESVYKINEVA